MFGHTLEDLNNIKIEHRVFIEWDDQTKCLVAKAGKSRHAESNILNALEEIRQHYKSATARARSGEPFYILTPPTASGMRSVLRPVEYRQGLVIVEMVGQKLPQNERERWNLLRKDIIEDNHKMFQHHLSSHISALAPHRGWMRLRVHFGHYNLPNYPKDFKKGGTFQRLQEIVKLPRAQASARFDKK